MSPTERGRTAETLAADHLMAAGLDVIERNWRTRYCELDIIARHHGVVHFVEVKYRASAAFGDGFSYITSDKRARLIRAAAAWSQLRRYTGSYQIDVISVIGESNHPVIEWRQNVIED